MACKYAKWALVVGGVVAVAVTGSKMAHSRNDMLAVAAMTGKMKAVCVGRVLIDVPADAQVSFRLASVAGFEITKRTEPSSTFVTALRARESALSTTFNMLGKKNIEWSHDIRHDGFSGKMYVHSRRRDYGIKDDGRIYFETVSVEGYLNKDDVTYSFVAETYDAARIAAVPKLLKLLTAQKGDEMPAKPGFCIGNAYIGDSSDLVRSEMVTMSAVMPDHPDLGIVLWTNSAKRTGGSLLERHETAKNPLIAVLMRTLHKGARTINGYVGEEVAIKVTELNLATVFGFVWETPGSDDTVLAPALTLEMDTGLSPRAGSRPVQSSLSEEAALALWNKISSSIRLRPTSPSPEKSLTGVQPISSGSVADNGSPAL